MKELIQRQAEELFEKYIETGDIEYLEQSVELVKSTKEKDFEKNRKSKFSKPDTGFKFFQELQFKYNGDIILMILENNLGINEYLNEDEEKELKECQDTLWKRIIEKRNSRKR